MSDVVYAVAGFHHGAQGDHLDDVLLGLAVYVAEHLVEVFGDVALAALGLELVTEFAYEIAEVH